LEAIDSLSDVLYSHLPQGYGDDQLSWRESKVQGTLFLWAS